MAGGRQHVRREEGENRAGLSHPTTFQKAIFFFTKADFQNMELREELQIIFKYRKH